MKILQLAATASLAMTVTILPLVIVGGEVIEDQDFSPQHTNDNNDAAWESGKEVGRHLQGRDDLAALGVDPPEFFFGGSPTMDPISEPTMDPLPSPTKPPTNKPTTYGASKGKYDTKGNGGAHGKGFGVGGHPQVCKDLKRMNCRKEPSCKWSKKKTTCIKKKIRKKKKNPGNQGHGGDKGKGNGNGPPCQDKKRKKCKMSHECRWNKNGRVCIPMPY